MSFIVLSFSNANSKQNKKVPAVTWPASKDTVNQRFVFLKVTFCSFNFFSTNTRSKQAHSEMNISKIPVVVIDSFQHDKF